MIGGTAAEEVEGMDVGADPVRQRLAGAGPRHRCSSTLRARPRTARACHTSPVLGVGDGDGHAGEVDEELLARVVLLAHDQVEPARPESVGVAEPGVAEAVGLALPILEPQQLQGHALAAQLAVDGRPVGRRVAGSVGGRADGGHEQAGLELRRRRARRAAASRGRPVRLGRGGRPRWHTACPRRWRPGGGSGPRRWWRRRSSRILRMVERGRGTGCRPRTDGSFEPRCRNRGALRSALRRPHRGVIGNPWNG